MENKSSAKKMYSGIAAIVLATLLFAQSAAAQEKRFLVRYDHGSANLAPWAGLKLYVGSEHVRILAGNELIHDIPVASITSVSHELRSPFDPAKTTERVFNDTLGACSNLVDCAVLGSAGVVGAAGVGVASLFTPKEFVITVNWHESGQPRELAMKIAWYQKDFILRALEKSTGRSAIERLPSAHAPVNIHSAKLPDAQTSTASPSISPSLDTTSVAATEISAAPKSQTASALPAAESRGPAAATESPELIRRFELVLYRSARVGDAVLQPGFYLVLVQERSNGKVMVVFLDNSAQDSPTTKILAKAFADLAPAVGVAAVQPVFTTTDSSAASSADDHSTASRVAALSEIRLPARTLKFSN